MRIKLTTKGLIFLFLGFSLFWAATASRTPSVIVLAGFFLAVFVSSLFLALWNIWPLRLSKRAALLKGFNLDLFLSRGHGTSYALSLRAGGFSAKVPSLKGLQKICLKGDVLPSKSSLKLWVFSDFPLGLVSVAKPLGRIKVEIMDEVQEEEGVVLAEYEGREALTRLDWKALARLGRLVIRRHDPQKGIPEEKPSPFPGSFPLTRAGSAIYSVFLLSALPCLLEGPWWLLPVFGVGVGYGVYRLFTKDPPLVSENHGAFLLLLIFFLGFWGLCSENFWLRLCGFLLGIGLIKGLSPLRERDLWQILVLAVLLIIWQALVGKPWPLLLLLSSLVLLSALYLSFSGFMGPGGPFPYFFLGISGLFGGLIFYVLGVWVLPFQAEIGLSPLLDLRFSGTLERKRELLGYLFFPGFVSDSIYLRQFVFDRYQDGRWRQKPLSRKCPRGPKRHYFLLLETELPFLPYWGCPEEISSSKGPFSWESLPPPGGKGLFRVEAVQGAPEAWFKEFLEVPPNIEKPLSPLVKRLQGRDLEETLERLRTFFQSFRYTLSPGRSYGDPILYFLKVRRSGYCEHFASAAALLLRLEGYPTRVVTGFLVKKSIFNLPVYPLFSDQAHAWVEVWDGKAWRSFDPTPGASLRRDFKIKSLVPILWFISLVSLSLALFLLIKGYFLRRGDPVHQFLHLFEKSGERKKPSETLSEFIARLKERYPWLKEELVNFNNLYLEVTFGEKKSKEDLNRSLQKIRAGLRQKTRNPD